MNATIQATKKRLLAIAGNNNAQNGFDAGASTKLKNAAGTEKEFLIRMFDTSESGLNDDEVTIRQQKFGLNEIAHEKAPAWYAQLFQAFLNPFIGILIALAIVSLITDVLLAAPGDRDYKTVIVVSVMVLLSSLLRFWQEFRSNKAAEQL